MSYSPRNFKRLIFNNRSKILHPSACSDTHTFYKGRAIEVSSLETMYNKSVYIFRVGWLKRLCGQTDLFQCLLFSHSVLSLVLLQRILELRESSTRPVHSRDIHLVDHLTMSTGQSTCRQTTIQTHTHIQTQTHTQTNRKNDVKTESINDTLDT